MKIARYHAAGSPEVIQIEEAAEPEPQANQVVVRIEANALNPIDRYLRAGLRPVNLPAVPHFDYSGSIVKTGSDVQKWQIGDRVWGTRTCSGLHAGAAAEFIAEDEDLLFPIPAAMGSAAAASLAMVSFTAHIALFSRAQVQPGERILIYGGSGGVGRTAIQLARRHGLGIISTASTALKAEIALQSGADEVIDLKTQNVVERVMDWSKGQGVDVILEMSASETIADDLQIVRNRGRIVAIGSPVNYQPTLPWLMLNRKNATVHGILVFTATQDELQKAGKEISQCMATGDLNAHIGARLPFSAIVQAHHLLDAGKTIGRIVLEMR